MRHTPSVRQLFRRMYMNPMLMHLPQTPHTETKRAPVNHGGREREFVPPVRFRMERTIAALLFAAFLNPSFIAQQTSQDPLLRWMDQIAQAQLQRRESVLANIHTAADAERRKQVVRQTILLLLGGLPDYRGPLNPRVTGTIQTDRYAIEKVIFESLPGFYVTANLYRPNQHRSRATRARCARAANGATTCV